MDIDTLLRLMVSKGASDLHLKVGAFPHLRIAGELVPLGEFGKVTKEDSLMMAFSIMTNKQKQRFRDSAEIDLGYGLKGLGRFRVNVFQQRGTVAISIRRSRQHPGLCRSVFAQSSGENLHGAARARAGNRNDRQRQVYQHRRHAQLHQ
jgi:Tfp pilus assembly pilus retraction ATPase PilT